METNFCAFEVLAAGVYLWVMLDFWPTKEGGISDYRNVPNLAYASLRWGQIGPRTQQPDKIAAQNQKSSEKRGLSHRMDMSINYLSNGVQPLLALSICC